MEFVKCNLCNNNSTKKLFKINGFDIVKCSKCGLVYTNPRLGEKEAVEVYKKDYYNNPGFLKKGTYFGYKNYLNEKKEITETFKKRLKVIESYKSKGRILDIGCALGFFLELAKSHGWETYGTEVSDSAYMHVKKNKGIKAFHGDLKKARFKNKFFDVVTMFDVIEHLTNPKGYLKEAKRILKKGGLLVINTPNSGSLAAKVLGKNWLEYKRVREHNYFFSHKTLEKMLKQEGFKVLRIESAGKIFSLGSIVEEAKVYNKPLFSLVKGGVNRLKLGNLKVYIDPRYKMTVYAKKVV